MSYLMILLDGVQDIAYEELGGKTPLEAGKGENYRRIEAQSAKVRFATTPPGWEPDTLVCTLTLFGLAPDRIPAGRTCIEAQAEGIPVEKDDLVLRCNFVRIGEDGSLEVPCCTPPDDVADALMAEVTKRHGSPLNRIGSYKCIQTIPGMRESLKGMRTFPPHNYQNKPLKDILPIGNELAESLGATTMELLERHRPYTVFNWGHSVYEELPTFEQLTGMKGALVNKTLVLEGVAKVMEMACPHVPGATGETDTNLKGKAQATLDLLKDGYFVVLHIGGTDEATHRQNPIEKAEFIRRVDEQLLGPILEGCPQDCKIMLTSDHEAYCSHAGHTDLPVEALLWENGKTHSGDLGVRDGAGAIPLFLGDEW